MQNFQDTFETRKLSFLSAFLVCMTVPLIQEWIDVYIILDMVIKKDNVS